MYVIWNKIDWLNIWIIASELFNIILNNFSQIINVSYLYANTCVATSHFSWWMIYTFIRGRFNYRIFAFISACACKRVRHNTYISTYVYTKSEDTVYRPCRPGFARNVVQINLICSIIQNNSEWMRVCAVVLDVILWAIIYPHKLYCGQDRWLSNRYIQCDYVSWVAMKYPMNVSFSCMYLLNDSGEIT